MKYLAAALEILALRCCTAGVVMATALVVSPSLYAQTPHNGGATNNQPTNVTVVNTPTVTVGNAVTVLEPAKQPVLITEWAQFSDGMDTLTGDPYNVPAGKRLVLEQFSIHCNGAGHYVDAYIKSTSADPAVYPVFLTATVMQWPADGASAFRAVGTTPMHWIQDSQSVAIVVNRSIKTGSSQCFATLAGYLTALPQ